MDDSEYFQKSMKGHKILLVSVYKAQKNSYWKHVAQQRK